MDIIWLSAAVSTGEGSPVKTSTVLDDEFHPIQNNGKTACQRSSVVILEPYEGVLEPPKKICHKTTWKKPNMMGLFGPQKWSSYVTLEFKENENPPCDLLLHKQLSK